MRSPHLTPKHKANRTKKGNKEFARRKRQFDRAKTQYLRDNPGSTYSPEKGARDPTR